MKNTRHATICLLWMLLTMAAGCTPLHPSTGAIITYMQKDAAYAQLPRGPQRVDAIYLEACRVTGSRAEAIDLLGALAVDEGIAFRHPFTTGLTETGMLAPNDKTGHFFAHAMWHWHDQQRLIPVAKSNGDLWEVLGEMKSWFTEGDGYDYRDQWANRLGWAFTDRIITETDDAHSPTLPSQIIAKADEFRPDQLPKDETVTDVHTVNTASQK